MKYVFHSFGKVPLVTESKNKEWTGIESELAQFFRSTGLMLSIPVSLVVLKVDIILNKLDTENEIDSLEKDDINSGYCGWGLSLVKRIH